MLHLQDFDSTITTAVSEYENIKYETLQTYKNKYDTKRLLPEYVTALNLKLRGVKRPNSIDKNNDG